jgi:hypothetical protein
MLIKSLLVTLAIVFYSVYLFLHKLSAFYNVYKTQRIAICLQFEKKQQINK